jgi:hypothetical protein
VAATADTVEVKSQVAADDRARLSFDPAGAERRSISFLDDAALSFSKAGVLLRVREGRDATVKIRPADPSSVPAELAALKGFKCEADDAVISVSLRGPPDVIFSEPQRELVRALRGLELRADALGRFGPIEALTWKVDGRFSVEEWTFPSGTRLLEVSLRAPIAEAASARAELDRFLAARGVAKVAGASKTQRAFEELAG